MGVDFKDIVPKTPIKLEDLSGKIVAIDAFNAIYQFLAIIRQPDGTPLQDSMGKITSHLSGLFYRTSNLIEMGIKPVYVFDGIPPTLKAAEIERRKQIKVEATIHYEKAAKKGDTTKMRRYAQATMTMKDYMKDDAQKLLGLMGLPYILAPSEGEAQAAFMTKSGDADYCASQDYDSLLFGAPKLLRNVTISGRRKLTSKNLYIDIVPEVIELAKALSETDLTYEQLIDVAILIGTDFNPDGIKGLGPKTALKLIKQHSTLENTIPHIKNATFPCEPAEIREIFLHPQVTDKYELNWKDPNVEGIIDFLCHQKDFSEERVKKSLDKMMEGSKKQKGKTSLDKWFG
ncbi:MAG: flap endonuclease-1 [Candidatus Bathyarchaeota archaeon]|nr:flap endonuclease-1 [Candidatus Bathyarchaeota archaeon]